MTRPAKNLVASMFCSALMIGCGGGDHIEECATAESSDMDGGLADSLVGLSVESTVQEENRKKAIDVVFLPEGFTSDEMGEYKQRVSALIDQISNDTAGIVYRRPALFNFHRVETASATNQLRNASRNDSVFGVCLKRDDPKFSRDWMLVSDASLAARVASTNVPEVDAVVVVANLDVGRANTQMSSLVGFAPIGQGNAVIPSVISILKTDDGKTLTHELGHALIGLEDEYSDSEEGYPEESPQTSIYRAWSGDRLAEVANLSLDPSGSKWQHLVSGAHEGGRRYGHGIFHPSTSCRMLSEGHPAFCPVCTDAIDKYFAVRDGANDGPPLISVALSESPESVSYALSLGITSFDRNGIQSVSATLGGKSLISSVFITPDGHIEVVPDVWRVESPNWVFFRGLSQSVAVPAGDNELIVTVTDSLGLAAVNTVPVHTLR